MGTQLENRAFDDTTVTATVQCAHCRKMMRIPVQRDWSSPLYVMQMEDEHRMLREQLVQMHKDMVELASECVDAGVRPSILKRADEINALFKSLKRRFGIDDESNSG